MIESSLVAFLGADTALAAIVEERIYALFAAQTVKTPFIVFSRVATNATSSYCGEDGLKHGHFQIDSYAKSFQAALELAATIRAMLIDFQGAMGGTHIASISLEMETTMLDPEPGLFRVLTTYNIWYAE